MKIYISEVIDASKKLGLWWKILEVGQDDWKKGMYWIKYSKVS